MAKKKRADALMPEFRPPSPGQVREMAAEHAARTAVESDPKLKRKVARLKDEILGTITRSLGKAK